MYGDSEVDEIRELIASGVRDVSDIYGNVLDAYNALEASIATLQAVTRASNSDAPGRALTSLRQAKDELSEAMTQMNSSAESAEQWAGSL